MSSGYRVVKLASGAHSVHSVAEAETFHPVIGPAAEAEALYVRQLRLAERLRDHTGDFVIWDVGLGAAANPVAALRAVRDLPASIRIFSFDHTLEPLTFALQHPAELDFLAGYETHLANLLATQPTTSADRQLAFQDGQAKVDWEIHVADFPTLLMQPAMQQLPKPHAIMFDAFSPAKNPAMWTLPLFTNLFRLLDPARPCSLPTYSRSTILRVTLLLAGFHVGVGHATGEKEETTLAANNPELIAQPLDRRWLARVRRSTSAEPLHPPRCRQSPLTGASLEIRSRPPHFS